jgi:hypothetical protein
MLKDRLEFRPKNVGWVFCRLAVQESAFWAKVDRNPLKTRKADFSMFCSRRQVAKPWYNFFP